MATIPPRRREVWLRQLVRKWGGLSNTGSCHRFNHDTDSSVVLNTDTLFGNLNFHASSIYCESKGSAGRWMITALIVKSDHREQTTGRSLRSCESSTSCRSIRAHQPQSFEVSRTMHWCEVNPRHCASSSLIIDNFGGASEGSSGVTVHTWNVAGKPPPDDLDMEGWIGSSSLPADIYVFGFQEVVPLNASNVLSVEDEGPAAKWEAKIRETLNKPRSLLNSSLESSTSVPLSTRRHHRRSGTEDDHSSDVDALVVTDVPEVSDVDKLLAELSSASASKLLRSSANEWTAALVPLRDSSPAAEPAGGSRSTPIMYLRVASKQMVGLFLTVWIRSHLWQHVHNVQVSTVGCGLMNHLGNKGSISVSMFLHHTSFCFVCSHLTSGHKDGDALRRNADVAEILRRTKFPRLAKLLGLGLPETILAHERVIWLGDLNYRLALPDKETWTLVKRGDWAALLRMDQLKLEQGEGRVFPDWQEGPIYFPPTYKYMKGSDEYYYDGGTSNPTMMMNHNGSAPPSSSSSSSMQQQDHGSHAPNISKRRSPAWCDRVLWYGEGLQQLDYNRQESRLSDHRCVWATFMAEVELVSRKKLKKSLQVRSTTVVPTVKPLIDVHKLPSNELWSSLLTILTPQRHKLLELELDTCSSDSNESLHEGDNLKHITALVDQAKLNLPQQKRGNYYRL